MGPLGKIRGLFGLGLLLLLTACGGGGGGSTDGGGGTGGGSSTDTSAPSVPAGLTASAVSAAQIDLAWTASTDDVGVTGYKIYSDFALVTSVTGTAWQNIGLVAGTGHCYTVAAVDAAGNVSAQQSEQVCATTQTNSSTIVFQSPLNDTGNTVWLNATTSGLFASPDYPGQDADFGRDAQARAGTLTKVGAGRAGFDFTKLDSNGNALETNSATWSCVRDNHTGLIWEEKSDDGGLRDKDNTYTWYNTDSTTNGGNAGTQNGGICTGGIFCDTVGYVTAVNATGLCGASDWRLPTRGELTSIVDNGIFFPAATIDGTYFRNTNANNYGNLSFWSSSPYVKGSDSAWSVDFADGSVIYYNKSRSDYLRLVRGGQ